MNLIKKIFSNNMVKFPLILFILCGTIATGLYYLNNATQLKISELEILSKEQAKKDVLGTIEYDRMSANDDDTYIKYYKGDALVAVVSEVVENGYGGDIEMSVCVFFKDDKATISGVKILSQNETAGLGAKSTEPDFLDQFKNKVKNITVNKQEPNGNEIAAITGATVTSKAVTRGVNEVLIKAEESYNAYKKEKAEKEAAELQARLEAEAKALEEANAEE